MCWRFGLALILAGAPALGDPLTFVRAVPLVSDLPGFGGLSAIEMREPGRAILLSDRGAAFTLTLARAQGQYIVAPSTQPQPHRDSEGLAYSADALFFSYEGPAQIVAQDGTALPTDPGFATYSSNGSFEALAADPDGVLYVLPERSGDITRPFPIHRFRDGVWDIPAHLPRTGPFLTAGADIGPDG
ncbi:MAG: esterase-like activity of phytase family protein, partial [Pseudomonadota bacterium]